MPRRTFTLALALASATLTGFMTAPLGCATPEKEPVTLLQPDASEAVDAGGQTDAARDTSGPEDDTGPAADASADTGPTDTGAADADAADADAADATDTADVDLPDRPDSLDWLSRDDDKPRGRLNYSSGPDDFYEFQRFEPNEPLRIWSLRARVLVREKTEVTLYLWDDFGGNFINFDHETPLATVTETVSPPEGDNFPGWTDFPLPRPVDLRPGRLVYAGIIVGESGDPQLMVDDGQPNPDDKPPASLVWQSNQPPDNRGFPALTGSPGNFMIRVGVERAFTVKPEDRVFEAKKVDELGLKSLRRVSLADVDDDGDLDVMANGPRLFLNDGKGHFTDASDTWLKGLEGVKSNGGVFADYDNDGDPDYFAAGGADSLLRNEGDKFVDVTEASKIDDTTAACGGDPKHVATEAVAWLDVDGDGWLDLYQANYQCSGAGGPMAPDRLWRNKGDGSFEAMTLPVGQDSPNGPTLAGRGVAPADADGDGDVDLLMANYRLNANTFLLNDAGSLLNRSTHSRLIGEGTSRGLKTYYGHSIGAAWGDVDQDGRLDVFVANLAHPRFIDFSHKSALYLNTGTANKKAPVFDEVTDKAGFRYQETPSNPNFWDYDNDGDLDLFYTCVYPNRPSQFYRNDGHPAWKEVSYPTGVEVHNGWGSAVGDIDGDGDLDLLARDRVFLNRNPAGHGAVFVNPVGGGAGKTNKSAIGARVEATINGQTILRERYGGHGTGVQDSPWLHVGLGGAQKTELTVTFPGTGKTVTIKDAKAGERIVVNENGVVNRK